LVSRCRDLLLAAGRRDALIALGRIAEFGRLAAAAQEATALRVIAALDVIQAESEIEGPPPGRVVH
jgi:hypothetical protein